jgi:hypothetical protein
MLCWILRRSGLCYLFRKYLWRNRAAILLYHDPKPAVIDAHLEYLEHVSRIVSFPKLWGSFSDGPLAAITIDDGAVGNLKLKDIFQKHHVRPMLYLCTGTICFDGGLWWRSVRSDQQVQKFKTLDNKVRKKLLYDLGFEETAKAVQRQVVPVERLRSLLEWADLGAHTRFHPILTRCEDQECQEEISCSREELLPFGVALNDFAYPNGDYSEREVRFVKDAGFESARTCDPGWNCSDSDRFRLKTIVIDDNASVDKFAVQLTGIPAIARRFFRKIWKPRTHAKNRKMQNLQ